MNGAAEAAIGTVKRTLAIANKRGLHARAAAKFVMIAERFGASVDVVRKGEPPVSARSRR